jgi:hypothetical protein
LVRRERYKKEHSSLGRTADCRTVPGSWERMAHCRKELDSLGRKAHCRTGHTELRNSERTAHSKMEPNTCCDAPGCNVLGIRMMVPPRRTAPSPERSTMGRHRSGSIPVRSALRNPACCRGRESDIRHPPSQRPAARERSSRAELASCFDPEALKEAIAALPDCIVGRDDGSAGVPFSWIGTIRGVVTPQPVGLDMLAGIVETVLTPVRKAPISEDG